jgi:serine/threonine protein phosphatase PrpC
VYHGVFDGHGGIFSAEWLAKTLHKNIHSRRQSMSGWQFAEQNVKKLITDVFINSDKELIKLPGHARTKDGSTALITMITGTYLLCKTFLMKKPLALLYVL